MVLEGKKRQVKFLYWEDCQSHDEALARLKKVLREDNINAEVEVIRIQTDEEARELRFIGSPTILVDGKDIQPPTTSRYGLVCRAYFLEDGRVSPLPSETMIRAAFKKRP